MDTVKADPLRCPRCFHFWHNETCHCGCKPFIDILKARQEELKAEKQLAKEKPHLDFIIAANQAGFTNEQAEFMWAYLAHADHRHWDGMIGGI